MARQTLLEMTQNILNAMDSDEVNSIGDAVESLQVAEVIKETYDYITAGLEIPGRAGIIKLDALGDLARPTVMKAPSNTEHIEWIKYNNIDVCYLEPKAFVDYVIMFSGDNVETVDGLPIKTDADPRFYTSFDDEYLHFDSYDKDVDSTLQQSKTLCWGQKELPFRMEDDFIPNLPLDLFPRLLAEAKATCFINYKQVANSKEEQRSRQQLVRNQNNRHKNGSKRPIDRLPNYARHR